MSYFVNNNINKKKKSRMCNKVLNNTGCPYGDSCNFAHNIDEITILECSYGDKCVFVVKDGNNKILNIDSDKICYFCHPDETITNFHERVGNVSSSTNYTFNKDKILLPDEIELCDIEPLRLEIEKNDKYTKVFKTKPEDVIFIPKDRVLEEVQKMLDLGEDTINIKII